MTEEGQEGAAPRYARGLRVVGFVLAALGAMSVPAGLATALDGSSASPIRFLVVPFALALLVGGLGLAFYQSWALPIALGAAVVAGLASLLGILLTRDLVSFLPFFLAMVATTYYLTRPHVRASLQ